MLLIAGSLYYRRNHNFRENTLQFSSSKQLQGEGELRCTHAEEGYAAASQISDFRQEEDYVLLH